MKARTMRRSIIAPRLSSRVHDRDASVVPVLSRQSRFRLGGR
jgi:hypothetical protein